MMGKEENAGILAICPFPTMFSKAFFHCDRIHSSLTSVHCFEDGYVERILCGALRNSFIKREIVCS